MSAKDEYSRPRSPAQLLTDARRAAVSGLLGALARVAQSDGDHGAARGLERASDCAGGGETRALHRGCGAVEPVQLRCHHRLAGLGCDCDRVEALRAYKKGQERTERVLAAAGASAEAWFVTLSLPDSMPARALPETDGDAARIVAAFSSAARRQAATDLLEAHAARRRLALAHRAQRGIKRLWAAWGAWIAEVKRWWGGRLLAWDAFAQVGDTGHRFHVHAVVVVHDRASRLADAAARAYLPRGWLVPAAVARVAARAAVNLPAGGPYVKVLRAKGKGRAAGRYAARYAGRGVAKETMEQGHLGQWWALAVGLRGVHLTRRSRLRPSLRPKPEPRTCPWCGRRVGAQGCVARLEGRAEAEAAARRGHPVELGWRLPDLAWADGARGGWLVPDDQRAVWQRAASAVRAAGGRLSDAAALLLSVHNPVDIAVE